MHDAHTHLCVCLVFLHIVVTYALFESKKSLLLRERVGGMRASIQNVIYDLKGSSLFTVVWESDGE